MSDKTHQVYCTFQEATAHQFPGHPESPNRIHALGEWLASPPYPEMHWLSSSTAAEADVMLVHKESLLSFLKAACLKGAHEFERSPSYVTKESYRAALDAVGATLAVSRRIISGERGRGFAMVRPPGHHAEPDLAMGFCLLNNIAVAAADAVASGLSKVAILDIDAHHGNGTQAAFWDTPEVGYFSIHEGNLFPGSGQIHSAPHARGRIINLPLPAFSGNQALLKVTNQVIEPWLRKFKPEMLFISAGYDTHFSDPLTTLTLDTSGYYQITKRLVDLANQYCHSRIMFVLEGGYDPVALQDNIQACLAGLCGHQEYDDHYGKGPDLGAEVAGLIKKLQNLHQLKED
jgi:acetoin utilization deacetylase AcuC-like enzyme